MTKLSYFVMQSSSVNADHVHQAPSQLHSSGGAPAAAAQYMSEGVTSTNDNDVTASGDITMENNPAYQSIEVVEAKSSALESTDYI